MEKMVCPATAANDSIKEEEFECKELIIDIPLALEPPRWPECCIYRVPKRLRGVKHMAYTPRLVSIGPFHHCMRKELKDMEIQKLRYLRDFCCRTRKSIEDLACIIERNEVRIRHSYSENFLLGSKEFVNMILLDAIFILELFWRKSKKSMAQKDYILSQPYMERGIRYDLLLLENQIPFFVLEDLYCGDQQNEAGLQNGELQQVLLTKRDILLKLSCRFFRDLYHDEQPEPKIGEVKHFTDLVRCFFPPPNPGQKPKENKRNIKHLYTATKLAEAGMKFRPTSGRSLLEIQFLKNECLESFPCLNLSWLLACLPCLKSTCFTRMQRFLEIPPLRVDDKTEGLFRNLMALEQCHYPFETYICDYIGLLDDLITTKADVGLLADKKIIVNELGSNVAVTDLFNKLGHEIESNGIFYLDLSKELDEYYENSWNRAVATLTSVYFQDFWRGTATVVGIIFLGLTLWNFIRLLRK
ncbi:UPF0481 protein At3g47200-like [Juglans microcarpa x Juglans regia]|uniref:UPF0481 protein At3g47200-like n=1 Tax=Juglans microcarpa x Juglans regia TaxID=2249226 RepID=UPI001B7DF5D0|nr:UPF0481 protein At3g47200-like [Juglans microcarpa x Juglans regia]